MRPRCSVFIAMSLDGFIARKDGTLDFLDSADPDVKADPEAHGYDAFIGSVDAIVIGRGTYDTVLGFGHWPYGSKRVIVLTHRPPPQPRASETFFAGIPGALLEQLGEAKRVYVDGGQVISQFFAAGLLDDLVISVIPIVLGEGLRLFPGQEGEHRLELESHRGFPGGMVQLRYRVKPTSK